MRIFTCKDCKDRVANPNCHSYCKKYLDAVKENEKQKQFNKRNMNKIIVRSDFSGNATNSHTHRNPHRRIK